MGLCGGEEEHRKLLSRINRVEGQVRGLKKMIQDDRDCMDVLKQTAAASGALRSIGMVLMEEHLKGCVASAIVSQNREEENVLVRQVVDVLKKFSR